MSLPSLKEQWFGNIKGDLLSGTVVALALIPEAIAFSIIAGVDPQVGLYASFAIAVVIAFAGGRPAMISAATGAMALVLATLVREHGVQYLIPVTLLTGVLQIAAGFLKLGSVLRFVSHSVVMGFVNALGILIFMAQLGEFHNASWHVYAMVAGALAMIYGLPYLTKAVPSSLITIIAMTIFSISVGLDVRTVGDMGDLPSGLPSLIWPDLSLMTWNTLQIILPYAVTLMAVGLLESLLTAVIVDERTDTPSRKNKECVGQGLANIASGLVGGMAGCAMIGQSMINVSSGGRGRLSTLWSGVFLLFLIVVLQDWVKQIPMPALVGVMIMVSFTTFNWVSVKNILTHPKSESLVMLSTVAVVLVTHDLAKGVLVGVLMSAVFFARTVSRLLTITTEKQNSFRTYYVAGQVFFASSNRFENAFEFKETDVSHVVIHLEQAHFWDFTSVSALDKVIIKLKKEGKIVELYGLNEASSTIIDKLGVHQKIQHLEQFSPH